MQGETCDFCLAGLFARHLVREYYRVRKGLVVMENVPAYVCNRCGERYYDADVAKQMRKLSTLGKQIKRRMTFPLVRFEGEKATG